MITLSMHHPAGRHRKRFTLHYCITATGSVTPLFGVAIYKRTGHHITDAAQTGPFTENRGIAAAIRKTLVRNFVTPMSLCCIVDQLLDERR